MNMPERNSRFQPPPHRRKTPSFSSSLLDSILRSIDESNDGELHEQVHNHDQDIVFFASKQKQTPQTHLINGEEQIPSLRRAIMTDQWMETRNNNNRSYSRKFSSDSSSSGTTSSETETPSTYRSLPNSFTSSRKTVESVSAVFCDNTQKTQKSSLTKRETKFMKSTKLKDMKIYGDLKKAKQPMSPGSRIPTFLYSLFSKKAKIEETMQNLLSLKKSRSIKQDTTTTCSSFSRSCMSKKQHNNGVKRSVTFYPENETVIFNRSTNLMPVKYEKRWFTEKNYKNFTVSVEDENEDEDEDEDDLFELEIVGGVGTCVYGQELPVFETTELRKIRI